MKIHESIVSEAVLEEFTIQGPSTLINYVANCVELPTVLALANLFWPTIIENNGMVFLGEFYPQDNRVHHVIELSPTQMEQLERVANAVSLGRLLASERLEVLENEKLLDAFGTALKFFWSLRLKELFPDRNISVEIGMNIGSEEGLVITFYQRRT